MIIENIKRPTTTDDFITREDNRNQWQKKTKQTPVHEKQANTQSMKGLMCMIENKIKTHLLFLKRRETNVVVMCARANHRGTF